ncbi:hypothetical protein M426DRAFT_324837, partial [Hypoxylon sp. CI-4A]
MSDPLKLPDFDPYKVLGIGRGASDRVLKTSYHRLCLQYHPDKAGPEAIANFLQIQQAYELLSDKPARAQYDQIYQSQNEVNTAKTQQERFERSQKEANAAAQAQWEQFYRAQNEANAAARAQWEQFEKAYERVYERAQKKANAAAAQAQREQFEAAYKKAQEEAYAAAQAQYNPFYNAHNGANTAAHAPHCRFHHHPHAANTGNVHSCHFHKHQSVFTVAEYSETTGVFSRDHSERPPNPASNSAFNPGFVTPDEIYNRLYELHWNMCDYLDKLTDLLVKRLSGVFTTTQSWRPLLAVRDDVNDKAQMIKGIAEVVNGIRSDQWGNTEEIRALVQAVERLESAKPVMDEIYSEFVRLTNLWYATLDRHEQRHYMNLIETEALNWHIRCGT